LGGLVKLNVEEYEARLSQAPFQRLTDNDELCSARHQRSVIQSKRPENCHLAIACPDCQSAVVGRASKLSHWCAQPKKGQKRRLGGWIPHRDLAVCATRSKYFSRVLIRQQRQTFSDDIRVRSAFFPPVLCRQNPTTTDDPPPIAS
jgi:hypothetical protein